MLDDKPGFLAIIPARKGSKGLPGKNALDLAGRPLLGWTVQAALDATHIDHVVLTSDSEEYLEIGRDCGAECISRPATLAKDDTLMAPVIFNVLQQIGDKKHNFKYIVLLQPTSPLRTALHIDKAILELMTCQAEALISVCETEHSPFKAFTLNREGCLQGVFNNEYPFMSRQSLPTTYRPNGAIYIILMSLFEATGHLLADKTMPFIMSQGCSIDIDSKRDLIEAENTLISGKTNS